MLENAFFESKTGLHFVKNIKRMDFKSSKHAAQFAIKQPQNTSVNPNATPFIDFGQGSIESIVPIYEPSKWYQRVCDLGPPFNTKFP